MDQNRSWTCKQLSSITLVDKNNILVRDVRDGPFEMMIPSLLPSLVVLHAMAAI